MIDRSLLHGNPLSTSRPASADVTCRGQVVGFDQIPTYPDNSPAPPRPVLIGISAANSLSLLSAASLAARASSLAISVRPCADGDRVFPNPPRPAWVTLSADESRGATVRPRSDPGRIGSPPLNTAGLLGLRTALPAPPLCYKDISVLSL